MVNQIFDRQTVGIPGTVTPDVIAARDSAVEASSIAVSASEQAAASERVAVAAEVSASRAAALAEASAAQAAAPTAEVVDAVLANPVSDASVRLAGAIASATAGLETKVERGLRSFHAALGRRHDAPVRILGLGHSFMEGEGADATSRRWWERFQRAVRTKIPMYDGNSPSGRGFIPAFYKAPSIPDPAKTGATTEVSTMGPGGRVLYMPSGATLTYNLTGTTAHVRFLGGPTSGTLNVTVDGVAKAPIATARPSSTDGLWTELSLGTSGAHTLVITSTGAGGCYVAGVEEFNGNEARGFQINEAAHAGFKITDFLAIKAGGGGDIHKLWNFPVADLYILEFGVNEWVAGTVTPTSFRTNLDKLVEIIRILAPKSSILYVADYQDLGTYTHTWSEFVQVYHDKAETDPDSCVLDMTLRMPTASVGAAGLGLSVSDGHPSNQGHMAYAEYVANFIVPR